MFDCISAVVNGWLAVNTIAALGLQIRFSCTHISSRGITESHLHAVVPYGGSTITISTELSAIVFISSKQSPCIKSIIIVPCSGVALHNNALLKIVVTR